METPFNLNAKTDCIQWLINASRKSHEPSVTEITQKTMGFVFAAAQQVSIVYQSSQYDTYRLLCSQLVTFSIDNLCKYPEYIPSLCKEISEMLEDNISRNGNEDMPLLDSFLKETARLFPLQAGKHES